MPTLPSLTVSQAHFDRLVASFPGATAAEKTTAYQNWLVNRLIERVEAVESRRIDEETNATKIAELEALKASLPAKQPEPELP